MAMRIVCAFPLNSSRATSWIFSPIVSFTESSFRTMSPPIPKGAFSFHSDYGALRLGAGADYRESCYIDIFHNHELKKIPFACVARGDRLHQLEFYGSADFHHQISLTSGQFLTEKPMSSG